MEKVYVKGDSPLSGSLLSVLQSFTVCCPPPPLPSHTPTSDHHLLTFSLQFRFYSEQSPSLNPLNCFHSMIYRFLPKKETYGSVLS